MHTKENRGKKNAEGFAGDPAFFFVRKRVYYIVGGAFPRGGIILTEQILYNYTVREFFVPPRRKPSQLARRRLRTPGFRPPLRFLLEILFYLTTQKRQAFGKVRAERLAGKDFIQCKTNDFSQKTRSEKGPC